jgi:hypothetical protein
MSYGFWSVVSVSNREDHHEADEGYGIRAFDDVLGHFFNHGEQTHHHLSLDWIETIKAYL